MGGWGPTATFNEAPHAEAALYLEVGGEGVGQPHVARECAQDQIAQLNTIGRYDVTEAIVIVTKEFGEVVEEDKQQAQRSLATKKTLLASQQQLSPQIFNDHWNDAKYSKKCSTN